MVVVNNHTLILHVQLRNTDAGLRDPEAQLEEACSLAEAISLKVVDKQIITLRAVRPGTYLGTGKLQEIANTVKARNINLVIFNGSLTPVQQRNLEKTWRCKVIDRTALILEIFGERAQTKEGVLQVELAALEYQKSRLVRSWTHLERQRGGFGFMGGPGERQIEADRRMINDRITKIRKQLDKVKRTRTLHRKARQEVPYPVVALVGYTNAGKSTLFNQLTGASVFAEDALFATLDPTMRMITLSSGRKVILSDTVGFISDLPTELIAAFRATLEEVIEADLILHIRDMASPDSKAQKADVLSVLEGLRGEEEKEMIEVLNKSDLIIKHQAPGTEHCKTISALTGHGCDELLEAINAYFARTEKRIEISIPVDDGKTLAWLHEHARDVTAEAINGEMRIKASLSAKNAARFDILLEQNEDRC